MNIKYNGWVIYWGQYGTPFEIANGLSKWWADIDGPNNQIISLARDYTSRDVAIAAAREAIDNERRLIRKEVLKQT